MCGQFYMSTDWNSGSSNYDLWRILYIQVKVHDNSIKGGSGMKAFTLFREVVKVLIYVRF